MNKDTFQKRMQECGDAIITYVSPVSRKLKYNVATIDLDIPYIASRKGTQEVGKEKVLIWCWDTNSFKQLDPSAVTKIEPLSRMVNRPARGKRSEGLGV